jgi:hypothetical protein
MLDWAQQQTIKETGERRAQNHTQRKGESKGRVVNEGKVFKEPQPSLLKATRPWDFLQEPQATDAGIVT